jgi:integrase
MARGSKTERSPGVWDVFVSAGRDPASGNRKRVSRRIHGTEVDAERALTALLHEADTGKHGGSLASVATVIERWWELEADDLAPTTRRRYRGIVDDYLLPRWGDTRIVDLDISDLSAWFRSLNRQNKLKPASVRQIRAVFRRAMEEAVRWEWIGSNPVHKAKGVRVPPLRAEADEPAVIIGLLEAAAEKDQELAEWAIVAATTGMRRSEIAGLMWSDVDLVEGRVRVHRAIVQVGADLYVKGTKTHQARTLTLDEDTLELLRARRVRAEELGRLDAEALVWSTSPDGLEPVTPDSMTQAWKRLCRSQNVEGVRLHDLRHFMATQAILGGLNVALVSKRLGHLNISTTLNIYTDNVEAADQAVADHMGSVLRRKPG